MAGGGYEVVSADQRVERGFTVWREGIRYCRGRFRPFFVDACRIEYAEDVRGGKGVDY
jgi:hypothetical protein